MRAVGSSRQRGFKASGFFSFYLFLFASWQHRAAFAQDFQSPALFDARPDDLQDVPGSPHTLPGINAWITESKQFQVLSNDFVDVVNSLGSDHGVRQTYQMALATD